MFSKQDNAANAYKVYSEENYKENIKNKNLRFLVLRRDSFGARMIALLNAVYCSKKFHFPFAFTWMEVWPNAMKKQKVGENQLTGVSAGKVDEIFSDDFIQKHYLPDEFLDIKELQEYTGLSLEPYQENENFCFNDLLYYKSETSFGWIMPHIFLCTLFKDIEKEEYRKSIAACWNDIGLSQEFCDIVKRVDSIKQKKGNFIAVHVRSGDIVYKWCCQCYLYTALAAELAVEVIVRELPHNNIILVGDDITSLERILEFSLQTLKEQNIDCNGHVISIAKDLLDEKKYDEIKLAFFDCYLLSKADKIFASKFSALSKLSYLISGTNDYVSCYEYFSEEEQFALIKKYIGKLNLHPAQQAFSNLHLMLLARKLNKTFAEQLAYADNMVSLYDLILKKVVYVFFLIQNNKNELFYRYIDTLSLEEIEELVKQALLPRVTDNYRIYKRFFIGIATAEKVRKAHLFSKIKRSFTEKEKGLFNRFGKKMRFKIFYHDLFNIKLHN